MNLIIGRLLVAVVFLTVPGFAQGQRGGQRGTPPTPRANAPIDVTGHWVSLVTEDWRFRMMTGRKGDFESVPLNAEGRRIGNLWDPAKDEAAGEQCKAYGAPAGFRQPGRIRIEWENDATLKIDQDNGTQTRRIHFNRSQPAGPRTWQGNSIGEWEYAGIDARSGDGAGGGGDAAKRAPGGSLKVVTTNLRAGYLRKNGVPYSENAVLTEYFDRIVDGSDTYLIVTAVVDDPAYLAQPFIVSTHFRKQSDASGWNPMPCSAR